MVGICPVCRVYRKLTNHHVFKRSVFGDRKNDTVITLCEECHQELEGRMPLRPTEGICVAILARMLEEDR